MFSAIVLTAIVLFAPLAIAVERNVPSEYATIQAAIDASSNGDVVIIAPGTYTGDGNRDIDFLGKAITVRSTDPNDPCVVAATVIDCNGSQNYPHCGFYIHSGEDIDAIVDGFTITRGTGNYIGNGGGIFIQNSSPAISNNVIAGNGGFNDFSGSGGNGGGIYSEGGSPLIKDNFITNNRANGSSFPVPHEECHLECEPWPGGICDWICETVWETVYEPGRGGGIYISGGSPVISNNIITANISAKVDGAVVGYGSGIYVVNGNPIITNCAFNGNSAGYGGGIYCTSTTLIVTNNTITANTATSGSGGGLYVSSSNVNVNDSIIWGNNSTELSGAATITFSDVNGGWTGTGNINADPCFVAGSGGSYYLSQIAAGQTTNSPCVDAGSNYAARIGFWDSSTRTDLVPDSDIVDMGYHSGRYNGSSPGNINNDCVVDMVDFAILASQWQQAPGTPSADIAPLGGDGIVDLDDLVLLAQSWLWMCPQ